MNLKEYTNTEHRHIESLPLTQSLINGSININVYRRYLTQRFVIFQSLELKLTLPGDLLRRYWVLQDISNLMAESVPQPLLDSTKEYVARIESTDNDTLMGDIYVNYLGELYGGQLIKKALPYSSLHLDFNTPKESIAYVRSKIENPNQTILDQAKQAFISLSKIYDEIQRPT